MKISIDELKDVTDEIRKTVAEKCISHAQPSDGKVYIGSLDGLVTALLGEDNPDDGFKTGVNVVAEGGYRYTGEHEYGARVLNNTKAMDGILDIFAEDICVVLPSSVHEILVTSACNAPSDIEEMSKMVHDINESEVLPEERLYDKALVYARGGKFYTNR